MKSGKPFFASIYDIIQLSPFPFSNIMLPSIPKLQKSFQIIFLLSHLHHKIQEKIFSNNQAKILIQ